MSAATVSTTAFTIRVEELAAMIGVSESKLYDQIRKFNEVEIGNGVFVPAIRNGRTILFGRAAVMRALEQVGAA
jgi:hypothetical protein